MRRRGREGFTLLEVVVAVVVSTLVLAGVRASIGQIADAADRLSRWQGEAVGRAVAQRTLRWIVWQAEGDEQPLYGTSQAVRFRSWCPTARGGSPVPCNVELALTPGRTGADLNLRMSGRELHLESGLMDASLTYLVDASHGGRWLPDWSLRLTLPAAVGIVSAGDTTVLRLGIAR